jgi:hypothetical protein
VGLVARRAEIIERHHRDRRQRPCGRTLELGEQLVHRPEARRRLGSEAALERTPHGGRDPSCGVRMGRLRAGGHHRIGECTEGVAGERRRAEQRAPQRHAEAELVRARVHCATEQLLRCHVRRGADDAVGPRLGQREAPARRMPCVRAGEAGRSRDAEVGDQDAIVGADQNVGRLEVAMHQPRIVCRGETATGLDERSDDLRRRARCARQPVGQRSTTDEFHRDERVAVLDADVVDPDHVGVGEPGHDLALATQGGGLRLTARAQHLDRDGPFELGIERFEHDPHPASADHGA